jgi:hypothetical protein
MADTKISALPAATTPLAGTEVLPIVQSGVTEKVAVDDLTVKNIRSNATNGILQIVGPAAAATRVMTTPDANFTAARTDAAQSFTGDQTLSTGNLVIGTSGKGIDFSATSSGTGTMTSELLADYEEGTFTPTVTYSGTNTPSYNLQTGRYTKIGRIVQIQILLAWNENGSTGSVNFTGLPFTSVNSNGRAVVTFLSFGLLLVTSSITGFVNSNSTSIEAFINDNAGTAVTATNTDNDQDVYMTVTYEAA